MTGEWIAGELERGENKQSADLQICRYPIKVDDTLAPTVQIDVKDFLDIDIDGSSGGGEVSSHSFNDDIHCQH